MKIVISGGGTGGHIYPALALRTEILKKYPEAEFLYIGTEKGLESKIVPEYQINFKSIHVQGLKRSLSLENFKTIWYLIKSISESKKILKAFNPDIVIGTGGYVCAPVLYAASKLKIATIIHEQNSVAGITNKFLAKYVNKICICFDDVKKDFIKYKEKIVLTGNPRGQEIINTKNQNDVMTKYNIDSSKKLILFFGGSRGAMNINTHFLKYYNDYANLNCQIIFVTGQVHYEKVIDQITAPANNITIMPYLNDMIDVLPHVDLLVCRSGATTLSEITSLGIASILVPSPYVTNNHQEKNARALVDHHAADIVLEHELESDKLYQLVKELAFDQEKLNEMKEKSKALGITDASDRLISVLEELVHSNSSRAAERLGA